MKDLYLNSNNNYIYCNYGNNSVGISCSPIREASRCCTEAEAKAYDRQEKRIKELERMKRSSY